MDNEEIDSELIRRYEEMLRRGERRYFDAEDLEDIAYEYELSEQYQEALDVIEYGLELHPGNPELLVRRAGYLLCLDRIDEAYLAEWERSIADAAAQQHGTDEGGCTTEKQARGESQTASTAQRIADFRARIADRKAREGKEYLSFYHIEGDTYEILK